METTGNYIVFMIIASAGAVMLMLFLIVDIFLSYKNKQLKHQNEMLALNSKYENEILTIKNEVTEQVFNDIAFELHDDICQTLSLAVVQIRQSEDFNGPIDQYISNSRDSILQARDDIKNISHTLSRDYWKNFDINTSLKRLNDKLNNTNRIKTNFNISPDIHFNSKDDEIIVIRVLQELINNSLKHSQASLIEVSLTLESGGIHLIYNDNGIGFNLNTITNGKGLGMISIKQRMKLLKAEWQINSENQKGFRFVSTIPITLSNE